MQQPVAEKEKDAVVLDVAVLKALLERNRYSHGRTLYFQRISMVLRSLQRFDILGMATEVERIQASVERFCSLIKEERWDMSRKTEEIELQKQLISDWSQIEQGVIHHIPEVLSRIRHAASALFTEISRGFFVPFCAVALASLSRIYVLLQRIGRNLLAECLAFSNRLSSLFGWKTKLLSATNVEKSLSLFTEDNLIELQRWSEEQYKMSKEAKSLKSLGLSPFQIPTEIIPLADESSVVTKGERLTDNDVGQAVLSSHFSQVEESKEQISAKKDPQPFLHDELDTNMKLVNDMKVRKSDSKKADALSLRKGKKDKGVSTTKKAKKAKKKDFFDTLFGE